ncbi:unnamed protein product, partial [Pelagomonas calceolata]
QTTNPYEGQGHLSRRRHLLPLFNLLLLDGLVLLLEDVAPRRELLEGLGAEHGADHPAKPFPRSAHIPIEPRDDLGRVGPRPDLGKVRVRQRVAVLQRVAAHVREFHFFFVDVRRIVDRDGPAQHPPLHGAPVLAGGAVDLVDRPRVPDDQIAGLRSEGREVVIFGQIALVDVHKHGIFRHALVVLRLLEVDGRAVVLGRVVHRDPPP